MKQFKENFKAEKIQLFDIDGKEHIIETKFIPSSVNKKIETITEDYLEEKKGHVDYIYSVMSILFGKPADYWKKFSIDLLAEVVKYVRNPEKKN
jgi:hypothetical protein